MNETKGGVARLSDHTPPMKGRLNGKESFGLPLVNAIFGAIVRTPRGDRGDGESDEERDMIIRNAA